MNVFLVTGAMLVALALGCRPPVSSGAGPAVAAHSAEGQPQPKLATIKLWLGPHEIVAEQAVTPAQIQKGMMFRSSMGEMEGMLFVFGEPSAVSFWMKNTVLPLTCAYIDPEGVIAEIHEMKPRDESPIPARSNQIQYVLEMNQGWFERNKVTVGMVVRTDRGTLRETYFRGR